MGMRLSPDEMLLYRRVDEVLHYIWDPIGVSTTPEARNEYESYLPKVFAMLKASEDGEDIKVYLRHVETDLMELAMTGESEQRVNEAVDALFVYRKLILNEREPEVS